MLRCQFFTLLGYFFIKKSSHKFQRLVNTDSIVRKKRMESIGYYHIVNRRVACSP